MKVLPNVISQHTEEAAFLWLLRENAVRAPHYLLKDIARLDSRVEAHLNGLRLAGASAWQLLKAEMEKGQGGETFAATVLALESREEERIQAVLQHGTASADRIRGLISALGWLPYEQASRLILAALNKQTPVFRRIAVAAAAIHRYHPGDGPLQTLLQDGDVGVQARTAKAIGELGIGQLVPALSARLSVEDAGCRFAAAWSIGLLNGAPGALSQLRRFVEEGSPFAGRAMQLAARRMPLDDANRWLDSLRQDKAPLRNVILGIGAAGDPRWMPFLLTQMGEKPLARIAGETFSMITGVHLSYDKLSLRPPENSGAGPTEDPTDPHVALDVDENLYWPDPEAVAKWWHGQKKKFTDGKRYLLGKPIEAPWLHEVLRIGRQRQRSAAALELAIAQPGKPLFEVRAPGFRQQQTLK